MKQINSIMLVVIVMMFAINSIAPIHTTVGTITTSAGYSAGTVGFVGLYEFLIVAAGIFAALQIFNI